MRHIVCYSGGHSSALVAIEVFRRFGPSNMILLHHAISPSVESEGVAAFRDEVAEYIGVGITYSNFKGLDAAELPDQFDNAIRIKSFTGGGKVALCSFAFKTKPARDWERENATPDDIFYFGFNHTETARADRIRAVYAKSGLQVCVPRQDWDMSIDDTRSIGIEPPACYAYFKHANCVGCLKAGRLHWYVVFCRYPEIYAKAEATEATIKRTVIQGISLATLRPLFESMLAAGIPAVQVANTQKFWADAKRKLKA